MAPSALRRAIGTVKDQTSIGLAKFSTSYSISLLNVAIVKATRHDERPASQRHVVNIVNLTCCSLPYVSSCVTTLSKRLHKTHNWVVAVKALMVVHRLLSQGDPSYEHEIFFRNWGGARLLNMSDFRDASRSNSWDFTAFVRTFARYLDEQLEFRINGLVSLRDKDEKEAYQKQQQQKKLGYFVTSACSTPVREMKIEHILMRSQQLQELLERFLACRPTGEAKTHRMVMFALQSLVAESFQIYFYIVEIMAILIERFMELEVPDCMKVLDIFSRASKQFTEVDIFYNWCKTAGIGRSSEYPRVQMITPKKLAVMDNFIRDKAALARCRKALKQEPHKPKVQEQTNIEALPAPQGFIQEIALEEKQEEENSVIVQNTQEANLIDIDDDASMTGEEYGDRMALALFPGDPLPPPAWEAFDDEPCDWETALVQSASKLSNQKVTLGGGFDLMMLDTMYQRAPTVGGGAHVGSASSMAFSGAVTTVLALPAPPVAGNGVQREDPFAASLAVAPPAYVQMWDMERKQQLLVVEQLMWEQYARNGMQGYHGLERLQGQAYPYHMGYSGYPQSHGS
ncbi:hypothetical protein MRB53_015030 [Persea americana]|uniref:Uncharacterized protein n=1 Tax=Persea americana TaxID=3435 RepID=A0ACC2KCJ8_PERAE|nr:hypothetical protein MRB53_015030 [Persea americana]